jgi:hypothetical protein
VLLVLCLFWLITTISRIRQDLEQMQLRQQWLEAELKRIKESGALPAKPNPAAKPAAPPPHQPPPNATGTPEAANQKKEHPFAAYLNPVKQKTDRLEKLPPDPAHIPVLGATELVTASDLEKALLDASADSPEAARESEQESKIKLLRNLQQTTAMPAPATSKKVRVPRDDDDEETVNWEKLLGVNLFAWVGGLALFLGAAFFVKYSFENNLINPAGRVAIGCATALGLMILGLKLPRERQAVTVQTLCATSILIFYACSFAAHSCYHLLGSLPAFGLMALTTAAAFFLAVKLDAQVVAVLGLLGGFLTPMLLSTGVDNPPGLFGYLALLDIGLAAVALRKRWTYLLLLAGIATVLMQFGWLSSFFVPAKIYVAMSIFIGFSALFAAVLIVSEKLKLADHWAASTAVLLPSAALLFPLTILYGNHSALADNIGLIFGFVFVIDLLLLVAPALRDDRRGITSWAGGMVFLLLYLWTNNRLSPELLNPLLGFYLLFAILHTVFPVLLQRWRPVKTPLWSAHLFPVLALGLILLPLMSLSHVSMLLWPVALLIDILAIIVAVAACSVVSIFAILLMTLFAMGLWVFNMPAADPALGAVLLVVGGFSVFFLAALIWAAAKLFETGMQAAAKTPLFESQAAELTPEMFTHLSAVSAALPFMLLIMVVRQLPMADPSPVFALAALLCVLLLAVARFFKVDLLAPVALCSVTLLQYVWHLHSYKPEQFNPASVWHLSFCALFGVFPFLFQSKMQERVLPWVASALALPIHFLLLYRTIDAAYPTFPCMGLLPAALSVPCGAGLWLIVRRTPRLLPARNTLLALFGGAALLFVTLIFPIQFERQWITIGWALEGLALLWLFQRVPHGGLRGVGCALLALSFFRLALNPAVITEYGRTGTPLFNWYLYAYGIVSASLLLGGKLLAPPRNNIGGANVQPVLYALGVVLAFLLLNIEIADYFSEPGLALIFKFNSNLSQDMTYSLAWGAFAFVLLAIGFNRQNAPTRYAGMGLMIVTILKLFLHDLWQLGGLYRVGSLLGLAVVLMLISFIYQRFLGKPPGDDNA